MGTDSNSAMTADKSAKLELPGLPEPVAYLSLKDGFCNAANSTTFRWFCEGNREGWKRGWPDGATLFYTADQMLALRAASVAYGRGELEGLVAKYDALRDSTDACTDGCCVVKRPKGMHTNGGCRCPSNPHKARKMMFAGQQLRDALEALLGKETK
jgi:hypothetical protein